MPITSAHTPAPASASPTDTAAESSCAMRSLRPRALNWRFLARPARNCVVIPLRRNSGAIARLISTSRGSSYSSTINGVAATASNEHPSPAAALAQKRLVRSSSESVGLWIAAVDRPKSRITSAAPMKAATMATRPKSSGTSSRARTATEPNWSRARPALGEEGDRDAAGGYAAQVSRPVVGRGNHDGQLLTRTGVGTISKAVPPTDRATGAVVTGLGTMALTRFTDVANQASEGYHRPTAWGVPRGLRAGGPCAWVGGLFDDCP